MNRALASALFNIGIQLEPVVVEAMGALLRRLADACRGPSFAEIAKAIVQGIEEDHPDWPGELKRRYAFDAIRRTIREDGTVPSPAEVNAMIELFAAEVS